MSELHQERDPTDTPGNDGEKSYVYQYIEITVQPGAVLNLSAIKNEGDNPSAVESSGADEVRFS